MFRLSLAQDGIRLGNRAAGERMRMDLLSESLQVEIEEPDDPSLHGHRRIDRDTGTIKSEDLCPASDSDNYRKLKRRMVAVNRWTVAYTVCTRKTQL